MKDFVPMVCANCKYWVPHNVNGKYPEDEDGRCKKVPNFIAFGGDEACDDFKQGKRVRLKKWDW